MCMCGAKEVFFKRVSLFFGTSFDRGYGRMGGEERRGEDL